MKRILVLLAAAVAALPCAGGEIVYWTDFNLLDPGYSLTGQDGWATNDIDSLQGYGETDGLATLIKPTSSGLNRSFAGAVGGFRGTIYPPGVHDILVWRPFTLAGTTLDFSVETVFVGSQTTGELSHLDAFGWSVRDHSGNEIFRLAFEPTSSHRNRLEIVGYDGLGNRTSSNRDVHRGPLYVIRIRIEPVVSGGERLTAVINDGFSDNTVATLDLPTGTIQSVGQVAANWRILDPAADEEGHPTVYGSNFMLFDEYRITTSVSDTVFAEGSTVAESAGTAAIVASISEPLADDLEIYYATAAGTALPGLDFGSMDSAALPLIIPAGQLSATLFIPIFNDTVAESKESFTVRFTGTDAPVAIGTPEITVFITDNDDFDRDGMSDVWEYANGLNPGLRQDAATDLDGDETVNLVEYALGLDPRKSDLGGLPVLATDGANLTLTYRRDTLLTNLVYRVESSSDLEEWSTVADSLVSESGGIQTRRASVPKVPGQRVFLRFVVDVVR